MKKLPEIHPDLRLKVLAILAAAQAVCYGAILQLSHRFNYDIPPEKHPVIAVLFFFAVAFGLYLLSLGLVWNFRGTERNPFRLTAIVFGFALLFRAVLWLSQPIQETDFYRYLWDGRVAAEGMNPYRFSPAQIEREGNLPESPLLLKNLAELKNRSPELQTIFSRINQRDVPTIYPPFSQALFAASALLTPANLSVVWQVRILKFILLLFDLATVAIIWAILRELAMPVGRTIAYAWCPLVLKEFANSAHLDSVAVCLVTLTVWLLIRARSVGEKRKSSLLDSLAAGAWALAILAKLYPIILAPVFIRFWWTRYRWSSVLLVGFSAAIVASTYLPIAKLERPDEADAFTGLRTFLTRWEMNDLLFMVAKENLGESKEWFTIMPDNLRTAIENRAGEMFHSFGITTTETSAAFLLTQLLMGAVVMAICFWAAFRSWTGDIRLRLLESVFLCLAWLWFLSPTQNPWYWTWTLPFIVFARSRIWLLVSGFAFLYYLRFWLENRFAQTSLLGTPYSGEQFFDYVLVWFEHLPILFILVVTGARKRVSRL